MPQKVRTVNFNASHQVQQEGCDPLSHDENVEVVNASLSRGDLGERNRPQT